MKSEPLNYNIVFITSVHSNQKSLMGLHVAPIPKTMARNFPAILSSHGSHPARLNLKIKMNPLDASHLKRSFLYPPILPYSTTYAWLKSSPS
jgi:hypothetical protein